MNSLHRNRITVKEGSTGVLYITGESKQQKRYIPDCDLDKTLCLLDEFIHLKDTMGHPIAGNYWYDGFNWFPTIINHLFGQIFYVYVKYQPIVQRMMNGETTLCSANEGSFFYLANLILGKKQGNVLKKRLYNILIAVNNRRVISNYPKRLLFFKHTLDDFRTVKIKETLNSMGVNYIEVISGDRKLLANNFLRGQPRYFYGATRTFGNLFGYRYRLDHLDGHAQILFKKSVGRIEAMMTAFIHEHRRHMSALKTGKYTTMLGIDDTEVVYPFLYACLKNNIRTIGYQHGATYNKRYANYSMPGINKVDYRWFDNIILYGQYWKDCFLRTHSSYTDEMGIIGGDAYGFAPLVRQYLDNGYQEKGNGPPRNILIPFEHLTNTYKIGRYIEKLIDLGYNIYFKKRPDERLEDQLDAYCLAQEYRARLIVSEQLDNELMSVIDIIAGSMSSIVYQLLPYNKIVWILETEYRIMEDLISAGYAHRVRYEDLDNMGKHLFTPTKVYFDYFYSSESIKETLEKNVLREKVSRK